MVRFGRVQQTIFELITIGYEILDGRILNTNAKWLAEKITSMGGKISRMITVGDVVDEIASVIKDALRRKVDWIITTGGLGPTYDDLTLEGVAKALKRKLVLNRTAYEMIRERYKMLAEKGIVESPEITPARLKMAMLPRGAKPLRNRVGSAPGVLLRYGKTWITCLPGVPAELYSIFEEELRPIIEKNLKKVYRVDKTIYVKKVAESSIAPRLVEIVKKYDGVYLKSHPKTIEGGISRIEFQISSMANKIEVAKEKIQKVAEDLKKIILEMGGEIEREK